jgi:hypothetical protein
MIIKMTLVTINLYLLMKNLPYLECLRTYNNVINYFPSLCYLKHLFSNHKILKIINPKLIIMSLLVAMILTLLLMVINKVQVRRMIMKMRIL